MEKKNADQETVSGASGILSVSQSFGSFGRDYKGIIPARDASSMNIERPKFSNHKIPGLLRRVFKGSDRKSRHQEVGEWSLEECRHSIMELAKELNRVLKNSAIPTHVSSEDTCSLEECRCFIMKWAGDLDKLVQQSARLVDRRKGVGPSEEDFTGAEEMEQNEGEELDEMEGCGKVVAGEYRGLNKKVEHYEEVGENEGEELNQEEEQRLKDGHDVIMEWTRELKTVPENSFSAGEAVEQDLAELVKEWKRGKLSNILPIMEFIMWALIKEEADKGIVTRMWFSRMLKSLNIGAGRCLPDSVWQWIHKASVDVTLDPDTAQPWLTLSEDGKRMRRGETRQDLPDNPERFDGWHCALGREGFTSGRHYWQVQVWGNTWWRLGVSRESAPRKGEFSMTPQKAYWTLQWWRCRDSHEFSALIDPETPLPSNLKPRRLGVYLDYEEGRLSFYNVETRSHIYTFTDMEFNPNEKLYQLFWTWDLNTDLVLESPDPVSAAD